ncbi:unnamed protein product, partial [Prorocentrum cordatum]
SLYYEIWSTNPRSFARTPRIAARPLGRRRWRRPGAAPPVTEGAPALLGEARVELRKLAWVCSGAASSTARGRGRADEEEGGRRKRGRGRRTQGDALTRQQNFQRLLQVRQVTNVVIGSSEASSASGSTWSWYPPAPCTSHR